MNQPLEFLETAAPEQVGLSSARLARLDAALQRYIDRGQVAGFVTLISRRGRVVHQGCYGQLDLSSARPMGPDTIFRIFSMTKPITSLAVLMLVEEGLLRLMDPVTFYIPELAGLRVLSDPANLDSDRLPLVRPVTVHDLLTHTSGLGYGLDASSPIEALHVRERTLRSDETLAEKMPRLARLPLHHQPGLRYTYSVGTDILGRLVEILSGLPLDEFFQQRIFAPLAMRDTAFYVPPEKLDRLATLYTPTHAGLLDVSTAPEPMLPQFLTGAWVNKETQPRFLSGGGGLVSTAPDYLRFAHLFLGNGSFAGQRLVSRKTIELMTAPHLRPDQFFVPGCSFGLGLIVMTSPAQAQLHGSPGAYGGGGAASTDFWVDPAEDMAAVLMTQYVSESPLPFTLDFKTLAMQAIID